MTSGNAAACIDDERQRQGGNAYATTKPCVRCRCCCYAANAEQILSYYYGQQPQQRRANLSTASYKKTTTTLISLPQWPLLSTSSTIQLVQRRRRHRKRQRTQRKGQKSNDESRQCLLLTMAAKMSPAKRQAAAKPGVRRKQRAKGCISSNSAIYSNGLAHNVDVRCHCSAILLFLSKKLLIDSPIKHPRHKSAERFITKPEEDYHSNTTFRNRRLFQSDFSLTSYKNRDERVTTFDHDDAKDDVTMLHRVNVKPSLQAFFALSTSVVVVAVVVGLLLSCFYLLPTAFAASANKAGVGHIGFPSLHRRPLTPFDYRPGTLRGTNLGRKGIGAGGNLRINLLYSDDGFELYDKMMPPFGTKVMTPIVLSVFVEALNDVNEFHEEISVFFWVTVRWFDPRLEWDPEEWNGTEVLMFRPHDIWVPRLVFDEQQAGVETFFLTSAVIHTTYNGECSMRGTIITNMKCSMLTRKFPFDSQTCKVTFFSMQNENITAVKSNLEAWSTSIAEWTTADIRVVKPTGVACYKDKNDEGLGSGIDYCYSLVIYAIKMHRHPMQHVLVWIVPSNIMALVAFIGLFVGCDAGERFSFGSSIMISINIYLIALSERLPVSRDSVPILGMYSWYRNKKSEKKAPPPGLNSSRCDTLHGSVEETHKRALERRPQCLPVQNRCGRAQPFLPNCHIISCSPDSSATSTLLCFTYTANYYFAMFTLICSAICVSSVSQNYRTFVLGSSPYPVPGHTSANNVQSQDHCRYNVKNTCTTHVEHPALAAARIGNRQNSGETYRNMNSSPAQSARSSRFPTASTSISQPLLTAANSATSQQRDLECGNPCDDLACPTYRPRYWKKHSVPTSSSTAARNNNKSPSSNSKLKPVPSANPPVSHELQPLRLNSSANPSSQPNGRVLTGTAAADSHGQPHKLSHSLLTNDKSNSLPNSNKKQRIQTKVQRPRLIVSPNSSCAAFNPSSNQCTCPECFDSPTVAENDDDNSDDNDDSNNHKIVTVASPYVDRSSSRSAHAGGASSHRSPFYTDTGQLNEATRLRRNISNNKLVRTMSSGQQTVTCATHLRTRLKAQRNIILGYASKFDIFLLLVCILLQMSVNLVAFYYWTTDDDEET